MKTIAIIPARGGSKGIPHKNIQPLVGIPLVAHTILAARSVPAVQRIIVSTDDAAIAALAVQHGAEVIWRPTELSSDSASSKSALLHVLGHLAQTEDYHPDLLVFLQCTSPLTAPEDIVGTIQALLDQNADTALAVTRFHYFLWQDAGGDFTGINHDKRIRLLRQERQPQYLETGAVYVMKVPGFLQAHHRFFGKTAYHILPPERVLEIDEPADLLVAEQFLRVRQRGEKASQLPHPLAGLALNFDGVFTDNRVSMDEDRHESIQVDRGDGYGLASLRKTGLPIVVISTETNPVATAFCHKLDLPTLQGVSDKPAALRAWASDCALDLSQVIFLGNDTSDIGCLHTVGCPIIVADAHPDVRRFARLILDHPGGRGAIRELVDLILNTPDALSSSPLMAASPALYPADPGFGEGPKGPN